MYKMMAAEYKIEDKLDKEISVVLERAEVYERAEISFKDFLQNKMLIMMVIRVGVPYSLFEKVQLFAPFSEEEWADLLDLSTRSLQRYKVADKSFGPLQSEKIIEMAEVTQTGLEVFGDMEKFKLWLETPNYALSGKPVELLKDSYGKELVISELTRINYGIFV
ncbi:MAG: DUF2384 domain-containing protein [Leadbetterella sp.]|nr:DUF2384 domain-containing protein [Leadbetterella sp.]